MPAKGGNPDLDDVEVARAVVHLANAGGAKFKEPEVKAQQRQMRLLNKLMLRLHTASAVSE
jgi:homospermidine synthase